MITNERQYRITKARADEFAHALHAMNLKERDRQVDPIIYAAELEGLASQLEDLRTDLLEYEVIKSGKLQSFEVTRFDELPGVLIKARIAQGLSQKKLAERLGLKEQQLQRYEATNYSSASVERIGQVIDALDLKVHKEIFLPSIPTTLERLYKTLTQSGFPKEFVNTRLLSPVMRANVDGGYKDRDPQLVLRAASRIGRVLSTPVASLFSGAQLTFTDTALGAVRYKTRRNANTKKVSAYTVYALYLSHLTVDATIDLPKKTVPTDSAGFRRMVIEKEGNLDFKAVLKMAWNLGIAVLPLLDSGAFNGACIRENGRNVIALKPNTKSVDRWLIDLLHEIFHAGKEPNKPEREIIEGDLKERLAMPEEVDATVFASNVSLDNRAEKLAELCADLADGSVERLKQVVPRVAQQESVPVGALADYIAFRLTQDGTTNWWGSATKLQDTSQNPWELARDEFLQNVNLGNLSEIDRSILLQALADPEEVSIDE